MTTLNVAASAYIPSTQPSLLHPTSQCEQNNGSTSKSRHRRKKKSSKNDPVNHRDDTSSSMGAAPTTLAPSTLVPSSIRRRRKPQGQNRGSEPKKETQHNTSRSNAISDPEVDSCLLCADSIHFYAVGECNHHGICSKCSMRMRLLMDDKNCPICKQYIDRVVVSSTKRSFESFELWGDTGGLDSLLDEASEIIFYECREHYRTLRNLRDFGCRMKKCNVNCNSLSKLKDHLRIEHGSEFCSLCMEHQHFFIQEHSVYTKGALKAHCIGTNRLTGPRSSGKDFHPICQFCKRRFYGDLQLYEHLERDHFRCHLCKKEHEYFRNYTSLEAHYRQHHHLCEDPVCLANRFVVFANDIEYNAHMRSIHGVVNRLMLNFQVARSGENPLAGLSDDVPESWSYESMEVVSPRVANTVETAFPALPSSTSAPAPVLQPAISRTSNGNTRFTARGVSRPSNSSAPPHGQAVRNQRLAEALGLGQPGQGPEAFVRELQTPRYSTQLVEWAKENMSYLQVIERRLERIVKDPSCHSVSLRPMPSEERALMHELSAFYDIPSQSFGEDPYRRTSFYKNEAASVPDVTLSTFIRGINNAPRSVGTASRLSFLPRQSQVNSQPESPKTTRPPAPANRGWEKVEPKHKPRVDDAWSDDE